MNEIEESMKKITTLFLIFGFCLASIVQAEDTPAASGATQEEKIQIARAAGPSFISDGATIVDVDGSVLVEGNNGWTCSPGTQTDFLDPHCMDEVWMSLMMAFKAGKPFSTPRMGFSYMLRGDRSVNNDDPMATDKSKGTWIAEGPHLMVVGPPGSLEGITHDPTSGVPYVMWKGTPYEHIMVPLVR